MSAVSHQPSRLLPLHFSFLPLATQIYKATCRSLFARAALLSCQFVGKKFPENLPLLLVIRFGQAFPVMSNVLLADEFAESLRRVGWRL
jgi:hypothetical protein